MAAKQKQKIKVIRSGELVDRNSTIIRSDQAQKLKKDNATKSTEAKASEGLRLWSKEPELIYSSRKELHCDGPCGRSSPTKAMYKFSNSNRRTVILCEDCRDTVELESFLNLDALDHPRKKHRVEHPDDE